MCSPFGTSYSYDEACAAAVRRAAQVNAPRFVVRDGDTFDVASEEDLDTFYAGAAVLGEVQPDGTWSTAD